MGIERIKSSVAAYQGSGSAPASAPEVKAENVAKSNRPKASEVSDNAVKNVSAKDVALTVGEESEDITAKTQEQRNAQIRKAVDDINRKYGNTEAIFGIHDATNRVTIKIVNKDTKDVIREVPPEKTLDMIAKVWELAGIMVDEKR